MTRIINTRSGAEEADANPIPRSELRSYLYTAARDAYQDFEACPWWRPLRRAYLRGLSDALRDAWTTWSETERHEEEREILEELGRVEPRGWRTTD